MIGPHGENGGYFEPGDAHLFDRDAEEYVLGECLRGENLTLIDRTLERLNIEAFTTDEHQIVFRTIGALRSEDKPVGTIPVELEIQRQGLEAKFGREPQSLFRALSACVYQSGGGAWVQEKIDQLAEMAARRKLLDIADKIRSDVRNPACLPNACSAEAEQALAKMGEEMDTQDGVWSTEIAADIFQEIRDPEIHQQHLGVPTGIAPLDDIITGLPPGELILVAGRTSMGKSALALGFAHSIMRGTGRPVLYVSMEMRRRDLMHRLIALESGVSLNVIQKRDLPTDDDLERLAAAEATLRNGPALIIEDKRNRTISEIVASSRRAKARHDIAAVVVDYVQLIDGMESSRRDQTRENQVATISRRLQSLPSILDIPVIALAQLNRNAESASRASDGHRPKMSDLRESGALEQDADKVLLVYRAEYYATDKNEVRGQAEIIVAKNRNGETGTAMVSYHGPTLQFYDGRLASEAFIPAPDEPGPRFSQQLFPPSRNGQHQPGGDF